MITARRLTTNAIKQNRLEALVPITGRHLEEAREKMIWISGLRRCDMGVKRGTQL